VAGVKRTRALALAALLAAACGTPPQPPAPAASAAPIAVATAPATASAAAPPAPPAAAVFPAGWPYPAHADPVVGAHGMVATDAALATKVGVDVLKEGGNAVDAAIAVAFALAVVHPAAGNIGGGGFLVARVGGAAHALDFRETAPLASKRDMYLDPSGKPTHDSVEGPRAPGVPGSVAGLWEAYQKLGSKKKTWAELLAPAIKLAREGFVADAEFARVVATHADRLAKFPASAALFLPGGKPVAAGSTWKDPDLAATLDRIAEKGAAGFYGGPTAKLVAAEMKRGKGLITAGDLESYKAKWREPLSFTYRGRRVTSMPPPSSGGVTLAMMAHILEGYDLPKMGWQSPVSLHYLFEAMRRAFASRNTLGDPDFVKNPIDLLMSDAWAARQRATIRPDRATPSAEVVAEKAPAGDGPHTTHFSVVDGNGDAVALTTTLNAWFGSGVTVAGAGFLLNDEMDDFAVKPGTPNMFGLVQGEENSIAPGKRMLSSMSPTIVESDDGKVSLVLGAAGGPTIITAVFQELSNAVDFGLDATAAVNAPRFHHQHWPDVIMYEDKGMSDPLKQALSGMGYQLKSSDHIADAPAIGRGANGFIGAAEPRRTGALAAGY
jgi:gamma-glutamyltranspeptidase / glutathione hydrolase